MDEFTALSCHARPRAVWIEVIQLFGVTVEVERVLWPWLRERRRSVHSVIRREKPWKPG